MHTKSRSDNYYQLWWMCSKIPEEISNNTNTTKNHTKCTDWFTIENYRWYQEPTGSFKEYFKKQQQQQQQPPSRLFFDVVFLSNRITTKLQLHGQVYPIIVKITNRKNPNDTKTQEWQKVYIEKKKKLPFIYIDTRE